MPMAPTGGCLAVCWAGRSGGSLVSRLGEWCLHGCMMYTSMRSLTHCCYSVRLLHPLIEQGPGGAQAGNRFQPPSGPASV
jgi:hypothetical protein